MSIPFKSDSVDVVQHQLLPSNIFDLLPTDHDCYLFRDLFEQLDTSSVETEYSSLGQHAYHPEKVIGILIYGYSHGVFSSRQLEKQSKIGQPRTISSDSKEGLRQRMKGHMEKDASKATYKERKVIVEPVFGHINNSGFRGFSLRGKDKVAGEFSLICAVHNIKKMVKAMMTGSVCPKFENVAIMGT